MSDNMQDAFRKGVADFEKKQAKKKSTEKQQLDEVASNLDSMGSSNISSGDRAAKSGLSQTTETRVHPEHHREHFEAQLKTLEIPDALAETRARVKAKMAVVKEKERGTNSPTEERLRELGGRERDRGKDDPTILRKALSKKPKSKKAKKLWDKLDRHVRAKKNAADRKRGKFKPQGHLKPTPDRFKKNHYLTNRENEELTGGVEFLQKKNLERVCMTHDYWYLMMAGVSLEFETTIEFYDIGDLTFMTRDQFNKILKEKMRLGHDIQVLPTEKVVARNHKRKGNLIGKWDEMTGIGWVYRTNRALRVVQDKYDIYRLWKEAAVEQGAKKFKVERPDVYSLTNTHEEKIMIVERTNKVVVDNTKAVKKFVKDGGKIKTTKRQVTMERKRREKEAKLKKVKRKVTYGKSKRAA